MNLYYHILTLLLIIHKITPLFMIIDPRELRCISRDMKSGEYFGGFFVVSGENETGIRVYIKNFNGGVLYDVEGQKNGSFQMSITADGVYSLCIENKISAQTIFSFEFSEDKLEEQVLSIRNIII
jgi:hypothetical protein